MTASTANGPLRHTIALLLLLIAASASLNHPAECPLPGSCVWNPRKSHGRARLEHNCFFELRARSRRCILNASFSSARPYLDIHTLWSNPSNPGAHPPPLLRLFLHSLAYTHSVFTDGIAVTTSAVALPTTTINLWLFDATAVEEKPTTNVGETWRFFNAEAELIRSKYNGVRLVVRALDVAAEWDALRAAKLPSSAAAHMRRIVSISAPQVLAVLRSLADVRVKSDLLRLLVIARYGGLYVDADHVILRDLRPLLQPVKGRLVARSNGRVEAGGGFFVRWGVKHGVNNAMFGFPAPPLHPGALALLEGAVRCADPKPGTFITPAIQRGRTACDGTTVTQPVLTKITVWSSWVTDMMWTRTGSGCSESQAALLYSGLSKSTMCAPLDVPALPKMSAVQQCLRLRRCLNPELQSFDDFAAAPIPPAPVTPPIRQLEAELGRWNGSFAYHWHGRFRRRVEAGSWASHLCAALGIVCND